MNTCLPSRHGGAQIQQVPILYVTVRDQLISPLVKAQFGAWVDCFLPN